MTRLSCHRLRANEVRLWLNLIAYNPREPVAAAGAADAGCHLVADQLAAAAGENRRAFDKACPVLLVAAGRESSHAPALRKHAAEDRGAAVAGGMRRPAEWSRFRWREMEERDKCLKTPLEERQFRVFYANARQNWSVAGPWKALWT